LPAFPQAEDLVARAEKAIEAGDYATALALLKQQAEKDPRDYRALFDIAYTYTMMGERAQAIETYRRTLAVRPQLTQASLNLGILLLEEKQPVEAARHFSDVVAARPADARAHLLLADAWAQAGEQAKAIEGYRKVIALDPRSRDACYSLARALIEQRNFAEAETLLTRAIELVPADVGVRLEMARLWELTGREEQALRFYSEVAQKQPGNAAARRRLGELLLARKQFAAAAAEFEAAAQSQPSPSDDWNLAQAYAAAKRADSALPLLRKLAAADPRNYDVRLLLGEMLTAQRDFATAREQLQVAVQLRPDIPDAWVDLANVLYLQQDYPATLVALNRVARLGRETPWLHYLRAITLDKLDQAQAALESYQRFLALSQNQYPDQQFQARQRIKALKLSLEKGGRRRKR